MPASSVSTSSESGSPSSSRAPSPAATPGVAHLIRKTQRDADGAKNEGTNPHWAFKPPPGASAVEHGEDSGEYDWDAAKDEDVELWLVRVPADVKPKHLESLQLDAPTSARAARIGAIPRKHTTYDVWSIGTETTDDKHTPAALAAGAEEMRGLSCLLPRKRKGGKLYVAPKAFARHIVVSAQATKPQPFSENGEVPVEHYQNPPRHSYPEEVLKHKFAPYGSATAGDVTPPVTTTAASGDANMAVDTPDADVDNAEVAQGKEKKSKKRKGEKEAEEVKKPKKPKVTTV